MSQHPEGQWNQWGQPQGYPGQPQQDQQGQQQWNPGGYNTGGYPQQPQNTGAYPPQPQNTGAYPQQPDATGAYPHSGAYPQQPHNTGAYDPGAYAQPTHAPQSPHAPQENTFAPSSYGGFGAFDGGSGQQKTKSKKPLIIAAAVVAVLAIGGVGAWALGAFSGDVLDAGSVRDGVTKVLRDSYGENDVKDVSCPDGQPIETGHEFSCTVRIDGKQKTVPLRVLNTKPEFEVGAPK